MLHSIVYQHGVAPRKIAVTVNARQYQGISRPTDRKTWIDFEKTCGMDLFCKGITKNPSQKTWIFSFVPQAQHHLRGTRNIISSKARTSLPPRAAQMNEVALRANDVLRNEVGLRPMMLRFAQTELSVRSVC